MRHAITAGRVLRLVPDRVSPAVTPGGGSQKIWPARTGWTDTGPARSGRGGRLSQSYPVPAGRARIERVERRSRFVATVDRTPSVSAARALIETVRAEFPGASHNVYAFAVGFGSSVTNGCGDDGEPSGTAGRPVLAVVQGSGLGDVCVVVTRYFGGTKLGTGGLVRAYTEAAQAVLAEAPRTVREERHLVEIVIAYGAYEPLLRILAAHGGRVDAEAFGPEVTVRVSVPEDRQADLVAAVAEATAGRAAVRAVEP